MVDESGAPDAPEQTDPIQVPITASGGLTKSRAIFVFGQLVAAVGALVGFLGLGETNWIVKLVRFFQSNQAVPVISVISWAVVSIALWYRNNRRTIERAVMTALLPDRIAKLTGPVHPTIRAAIDEAIQAKLVGRPAASPVATTDELLAQAKKENP